MEQSVTDVDAESRGTVKPEPITTDCRVPLDTRVVYIDVLIILIDGWDIKVQMTGFAADRRPNVIYAIE